MTIYNQTSIRKKYIGGLLIGVLIIPAASLFIQGLVLYGILLTLTYLIIETSRSGVEFDFNHSKLTRFRDFLFFIKIPLSEDDLNGFSHYRVKLRDDSTTISANWVQYSIVSKENFTLELFKRDKGKFIQIVKSEPILIQSVLRALEAQNISAFEE